MKKIEEVSLTQNEKQIEEKESKVKEDQKQSDKHSHKHKKKEKFNEQDKDKNSHKHKKRKGKDKDDKEKDNDESTIHSHKHKKKKTKKDKETKKEGKKSKTQKLKSESLVQKINDDKYQSYDDDDNNNNEEEEEEEDESDDFEIEQEEEYEIHEQLPFSFVKRVDLQKNIDNQITEVSNLFCKSRDEAILLLIQYHWKTEKLTTAFFANQEVCLKSAGIFISINATQQNNNDNDNKKKKKKEKKEQICPICFSQLNPEKDSIYFLHCGHSFCQYCISMYIKTQFLQGPASISMMCPEQKCSGKIYPSLIKEVLSKFNIQQQTKGKEGKVQNALEVEQFNIYIQDNFIESQRNKLCYCINPKCNLVAKCEDPLRYDVNCQCGTRYCFKCARSNHVPTTCEMMDKWEKMTKSESANFLWIQANTKKCPFCSCSIQKNGGCFQMCCLKCKKYFCWVCLKDWASHNDHFSCNTPMGQRPSDKQASKAKEELDYGRFYFERVDEQKKSLRYAQNQLEDVQYKQKLYQSLYNCDEKTTEFIRDSAITLVRLREFILHSYIFGYSVPKCQAKSLFELQQGDLLASTEQLCRIQEGQIQKLDRMQMLRFSALSQQHLDNLIKFFSTEALGMIQIK